MAEILPLPKPGVREWPTLYQNPAFWPQDLQQQGGEAGDAPQPWHPGAAGHNAYQAYALPRRAHRIMEQVHQSKPQVVLIHGVHAHDQWVFEHIGARALWKTVQLDPAHPKGFPTHFLRLHETLFVRTYNLGKGVFYGGWRLNQRVDRLAAVIQERM